MLSQTFLEGRIQRYFCWEPIEARFLKIQEVDGVAVSGETLVYPMQLALPMGFSWATYLAQSAASRKFGESTPPLISQQLTDIAEARVINCQPGHCCHYVSISTT